MMRVATFALFSFCAGAAAAHQQAISYGELVAEGAIVRGTFRFSLADLRTQMDVEPARLDALAPALAHLLAEPVIVRADGAPCSLQADSQAAMDGEDGVALSVAWSCPHAPDELAVRAGFLETFPPGHTHLVKVQLGPGEVSQRIATADEPSFEVRRARDWRKEAARFVLLGVEHIFTGYDHVAFLIGLLLLGGSLGALVKIVTAFTVAHSITLALATLGVVAPSPRIVEPLIAASIAYVGIENLWALSRGDPARALARRWMLTFAFGLVHGFGFASVLRALRLPRPVLATGLVSFNVGVEVGQVCIVALALPLLRRLQLGPRGARVLSGAIAALGLVWVVLRLV